MPLSTSDGYFGAVLGRDTWNRDVGTDIHLLYFRRYRLRRTVVNKALYGRVSIGALFVFCILYNGIFAWGFMNYLFGLGMAMLAFGTYLLLRERYGHVRRHGDLLAHWVQNRGDQAIAGSDFGVEAAPNIKPSAATMSARSAT